MREHLDSTSICRTVVALQLAAALLGTAEWPGVATQRPGASAAAQGAGTLRVPDVPVVDQDGRRLKFWSDLVAGKVVAVSFIFTTCTTICPPIGANFGRLEKLLAGRLGPGMSLISVSVDPATDTPQRLKAWARQFGGGPGWTLVTGSKSDIDRLLKALQAYTPNYADHSPLLLVGNAATGVWQRTSGLAPPGEIAKLIQQLAPPAAAAAADESAAHRYFTDVALVDQDGVERRLYSDLLRGKTVVVESFFTSCAGACPVLTGKLAAMQDWLGGRLGAEVRLLSLTVDPETDTPARLKQHAERLGAKPGWFFLTGKRESVEVALRKFGLQAASPQDHSNLLIVGNEATGLWKKLFGLSPTEELIRSLDAVLHDR